MLSRSKSKAFDLKELVFKNNSDHPVNLLDFLQKENGVSAKLIRKLKRQNMGITCDGKLIRTIDDVPAGSSVVLHTEDENTLVPNGELNVPVIYEDDMTAVFNKPQNMPVHPSLNHYSDTLGNYFAFLYPDTAFRAVNRLDRNTSGLCITAKSQHAAFLLQKRAEKVYYAIVCGYPGEEGTIDAPIERESESLIRRCVREGGAHAVTHFKTLSTCGKYSLLKIKLETGRTHQIRVHFSHLGFPLAGDDLYGGSCEEIDCQALHCGEIFIGNYFENKELHLVAPLNDKMNDLMKKYDFYYKLIL